MGRSPIEAKEGHQLAGRSVCRKMSRAAGVGFLLLKEAQRSRSYAVQNDKWKFGVFDEKSFASSYGEDGDLYFSDQFIADEDKGLFISDANGQPQTAAAALLIRWSEIRYFDFAKWGKPEETPNPVDGSLPVQGAPEARNGDDWSGDG
jgi:hypothetical protein